MTGRGAGRAESTKLVPAALVCGRAEAPLSGLALGVGEGKGFPSGVVLEVAEKCRDGARVVESAVDARRGSVRFPAPVTVLMKVSFAEPRVC